MLEDTIAAISTAMGEAGIGIVRVSGWDSIDIVSRIFLPKDNERFRLRGSYKLYYGQVYNPDTNMEIDQVIVSIMKGPNSFTGEDVVEINCHGGLVAQRDILSLLLKYGARLAEPGEFTKRAFINGKMDLAQAEAVIDLIRAKTSLSAVSAVEQLRGRLSNRIREVRHVLLEVLAHIEAGIDFPEEDLELDDIENLKANVETAIQEIEELLDSAKRGRILRDGLNTAIIGQPNVGKSSLLNALLREEKAIVTDIPGTTRDVLEEYISLKGIPLKIIDTAGIRETEDLIERLGVDRALKVLEDADLVLFVIDAGRELNPEENSLLNRIPKDKLVIVVNKIDIHKNLQVGFDAPVFYISALKKEGIEQLEDGISELVTGKPTGETPVISNIRHINTLERAKDKLHEALWSISQSTPLDLVSIDLRSAWEMLGEIIGDEVSSDLLDEIFSRFCIGK